MVRRVNSRQRHALAHPLSGGPSSTNEVAALTSYRERGDGSLLTAILAVDR